MSYSQETLAQAVSEYRAGNYPTIRAAAKSFAIPYSTLKDHVKKCHQVSSLTDRLALESRSTQRPVTRPSTPRRGNSPFDPEKTPRKPSDCSKTLDYCRSLGSTEDSYSFLEKAFQKALRRIGSQTAELIKNDRRIEILELQLADQAPTKRRKIRIDSSSKFARINDIKDTRDRENAIAGPSSISKDTMMLQQGETVSNWGTVYFPESLKVIIDALGGGMTILLAAALLEFSSRLYVTERFFCPNIWHVGYRKMSIFLSMQRAHGCV